MDTGIQDAYDVASVWAQARRALEGLPGQGLNIAHEAVTRHARDGAGARVALRYLAPDGSVSTQTYAELEAESARFAGALQRLGVERGERVVWLGGRRPELFVALLASLRLGAVFCPLFTAFGPQPLATRLELAAPRIVITTAALLRHRFAAMSAPLPGSPRVVVLDGAEPPIGVDAIRYSECLAAVRNPVATAATTPDDSALLHFTSGTTGRPKGVVHAHEAVVAHRHSARVALDLRPEDIYWCTADPGWVTGVSYGVIAPLVVGATVLVDGGEFEPQRWMEILERQRVSVWYTAPTALRMMRRVGAGIPRPGGLSLRLAASVGEPLDAASVVWGEDALGCAVRDTWWQTETGAIMIANSPAIGVRPGSMGKPLPGVETAVVQRLADGGLHYLTVAGEQGELALRAGWPSMFRDYLGERERYRACFREGWYLSGDLVRRDEDGWYHFVGRADDLIKCAGHLIGPTEVEAALLSHPAVADAAVVGLPDSVTGERVEAFVVPVEGSRGTPELQQELIAHARRRLGAAVAPRAVTFRTELPHTRSGKTVRRLLRAEALGEEPGDLSAVAGDETNREGNE